MTRVKFEYTKTAGTGEEVPIQFKIRFAPIERVQDGTGTVLKNWWDATGYGSVVVDLDPNDRTWAWQMSEIRGPSDTKETYTFNVPDSSLTLRFEDLEKVDPKTFLPIEDENPAWLSTIESMEHRVSSLETAIMDATKIIVLAAGETVPPGTEPGTVIIRTTV